METPPRDKQFGGAMAPPKQLHARLKMQMMESDDMNDMDSSSSSHHRQHPEMEQRMGDEVPVHTAALKPLDDDFDDEDLD